MEGKERMQTNYRESNKDHKRCEKEEKGEYLKATKQNACSTVVQAVVVLLQELPCKKSVVPSVPSTLPPPMQAGFFLFL